MIFIDKQLAQKLECAEGRANAGACAYALLFEMAISIELNRRR